MPGLPAARNNKTRQIHETAIFQDTGQQARQDSNSWKRGNIQDKLKIGPIWGMRETPGCGIGRRTSGTTWRYHVLKRLSWENKETKAGRTLRTDNQTEVSCTERELPRSAVPPLSIQQSSDWCVVEIHWRNEWFQELCKTR